MEKNEKLTLDAKQRHLAKLKKQLAKHERKLERSLRVSQAKEHVRKKLKEQALIQAAENESLVKENLSFDSKDNQSFNNSCLSSFVSKDSDVTVVDLSTVDLTLSGVKEGDRTLSDINRADKTKLNDTSGEIKAAFNYESRLATVNKQSSKNECSISTIAVKQVSPNLNIKVLDETANQGQRKQCSDVSTVSKKQSPSSRSHFLNAENASFSNDILSSTNVTPKRLLSCSTNQKSSPGNKKTPINPKPSSSNYRIPTNQKPSPSNQKTPTIKNPSPSNQKTPTIQKPSPSNHKTPTIQKPSPSNQKTPTIKNPSPSNQKTPTIQKPSPSNQKTPTIKKPSPSNQKTPTIKNPSPSNHKTPTIQKPSPSNQKTPTIKKPSPSNQKTPTIKNPSPSNHKTPDIQKPSPSNQKTPTIQKPSPSNQKTPTIKKPSPSNQKTPTIKNPSPSNQKTPTIQKPSPSNHKTPTIQKPSPSNQKALTYVNQKPSATNQKSSPPNQKSSPNNQKTLLDDSGISQSSLEISRISFLNDSLSLTPTFGEDGDRKSRQKMDRPWSEKKLRNPKRSLHFQASEIDFSGVESSDVLERNQNKKSSKSESIHEESNFDTIEFISQTKSGQKPKIKSTNPQQSVYIQPQTSKTKLKEAEKFQSVTENSFDSRSKRNSESLALSGLKIVPSNDLGLNSEKISENSFPNDKDVQKVSQEDLNFGSMEGMNPDLPILIIDRKSKRRSRSRHKSSRQTSSPILSQKEATTSRKISSSAAKPKSGADIPKPSSKIDSLAVESSKCLEMQMQADTMDPQLMQPQNTAVQAYATEPETIKQKRSSRVQANAINPELTKNKIETPIDLQQTQNKRTEKQNRRKARDVDGDSTEVSESDSQKSISILVDTSKSMSSSFILDEKISIIESDSDLTLVSPQSDGNSSQSLLKSSKKHSSKGYVSTNDSETKLVHNLTACVIMEENSCSIMTPCNTEKPSSQEKNSSQNSHLSDSLALKRRKFKQRKRSLSHEQEGSESLGSSQDSKRLKVSETSQDSSSMNSGEESMNYKLSSKRSRKGIANNSRLIQESNEYKTFKKQDDSNSQNSNLSNNSKISKHHQLPTASKNEIADPKQNRELSQYSEFTELDAVEFSQFKFSEEFLTESSENTERGQRRKRKRHPSHLGMIVQRRSPRVASLVDSESSSNGCSDNSRHRRTKHEKCLIISSVFQYLVDETKRESKIQEFELPDSQFKDLMDVKILENNFELDDNIPSVKTVLCAQKIESPLCHNSDTLNIENGDVKSCEIDDNVTGNKCESPNVDTYDTVPSNKCDEQENCFKTFENDNSAWYAISLKESTDTLSQKKPSGNGTLSQNSLKLTQSSQFTASDLNTSEVEKSKQGTKAKNSEKNVNSVSDIKVIYDTEPMDENFLNRDEESKSIIANQREFRTEKSTSSKAQRESLTKDLEKDIQVIYDSEPIPDDSMSEEKCYHRNDATDLQENDLSTISEKCSIDNLVFNDNFVKNENKILEDVAKSTKKGEHESSKADNLERTVKGDKFESIKQLESSVVQPKQVEALHENLDDSEVTFKNNILLAVSTPKFSAKNKRKSKSLFRNSTSTPKCANLSKTPKTPNLDEVKSSTPKINAKFVDSVSNVESFETPKAELSKFHENLDAYTTPKDANIRRHFNFADDNLSPPLFPTQKDLTPVGVRRLEDETLDSFVQLDADETNCDDLIGPRDCIKLCREENVVFISGGNWTSEGHEHSYIVCLLPSAITVWSQGQGQWENELDWYLSQTYQAIEGWIIKKPNKIVLVILEEDKTGEQRVSLFYYDLLSGDSNMNVIDLNISDTNPVTSLLCCIVNDDQLIIGYNHCTSLTATKHILIDGYKQMSLCCHLESTSGYLMDLAEVKHLDCCVVGLTSKREALIWNHEAGFLIKKINLDSVITPGVSLTAVHNIQGYLVCHLLYRVKSDSPGYVVIVNISNNSSLILHDYPPLQFSWKGLKSAVISGDSLLASDIHGNTGFWDMVSGELLADIPRSKVTSGNINQSDQTLYLGLDSGAVHIYPLENIIKS